MASIALDSITKNADSTWTYTWTDGNPQPVYLRGDYMGDFTDTYTSGVFTTPPSIEVGLGAVTRTLAPWVDVVWNGAPPATRYRVQRYDGTDWIDVGEVAETGNGTYRFRLRPTLGQEQSVRVISDFGDWPSTVIPVTSFAPEDPPPLDVWYDTDTNEVVIEELF